MEFVMALSNADVYEAQEEADLEDLFFARNKSVKEENLDLQIDLKNIMKDLLGCLTDREVKVIVMAHGISLPPETPVSDFEGMRDFALTACRIREVEKKAILNFGRKHCGKIPVAPSTWRWSDWGYILYFELNEREESDETN